MNDIETLLKSVLPDKKKLKADIIPVEIHELVKGEYIADNIFKVEHNYGINEIHLGKKLKEFKIHPLITKYSKIKAPKFNNLIFIDTETTGLAGGTGTYIFLIGIGYFKDHKVILKQYFLTDLINEKDLIEQLLKSINKDTIYVSYNGKSYDVPLINSRSVFHKCMGRLNKFNNIDLLHISRRFWRDMLDNFSLQNIERNILNSVRVGENDIPGSAIPDAYFNYLQTKNAIIMQNVIYHNRIDILSLIVLFEKINNILYSSDLSSVNSLEIGRLYMQADMVKKAIEIFNDIIEKNPNNLQAIKELSFIYKRKGELTKAADLWLKAAQFNEEYAFLELAKLEEHCHHDYPKALNWTEKALSSKFEDPTYNNEDTHKLQHRRKRLERLKIKN